jgi:hypothetical protein
MIQEIDWDAAYRRLLLATPDGVYAMGLDRSLRLLLSGPAESVEAVQSVPGFYHWLIRDQWAYVLGESGAIHASFPARDTRFDPALNGLAFTQTHAFLTTPDAIRKYDKLEFQSRIRYCIFGPDIDADGAVALSDLALLAADWQSEQPSDADLDCDGRVNLSDFALLAQNWLTP